MPSEPNPSLADCITNIPSRWPARDRVFADHGPIRPPRPTGAAPNLHRTSDKTVFENGILLTFNARPGLLPRNQPGSDDDHAHPCGTGKAISPTSHRSTRLSHQQSAKFNELRQSAARRASDIERSGGIGNESPHKPTNGKTSAHALVGRRCAFASTGSMRGPRSPTRGAFSGMVPSLPGTSPNHVRPSGLRRFTPNLVPRPFRRVG